MANREACELYIEQEIKSELEKGKKPYSIGKDLAAWIEKLFEVNIKPETIEKRAERLRNENPTNVGNDSTPLNDSENSNNKEISKELTAKGEPRKRAPGAGRKMTQKIAWGKAEQMLKKLTEFMKKNCEIEPNIDEKLKINIRAYIDLLNSFNDEL